LIPQAKQWLSEARRIAVLTGAGVSAESGVPTFRGPEGLWRTFKPEELATPAAFARDPKLVWEWYDWRRALISKVEPNAGHIALAALEDRTPEFTLITQTWTDCTNAPAVIVSCGSTAASGGYGAWTAARRILTTVFRCLSCLRDVAAANWYGRAWSGSVNRCRGRNGRRPSAR